MGKFVKKCETCSNEFNPGKHKEKKNCSKECLSIYQDKHKNERIEKSQKAFKKKYGVAHVSQIEGFQEKVKKTKKDRYGDENYNNRKKSEETCLSKYGVKFNTQHKDIKDKIKITKKERYGDEGYNNREKAHSTILEKYGVDHHLQTEESMQKLRNTNLKKYNTEYTVTTKKSKKRRKEVMKHKYGCEWYFNSKEYLEKSRMLKIKTISFILESGGFKFDFESYTKLREKLPAGKIKYLKYGIECLKCGNEFETRLVNKNAHMS